MSYVFTYTLCINFTKINNLAVAMGIAWNLPPTFLRRQMSTLTDYKSITANCGYHSALCGSIVYFLRTMLAAVLQMLDICSSDFVHVAFVQL